jgi:PAS domain S-box-containing protein
VNPPFADPVLQTVAVGTTISGMAGIAALYLWSEDRRQRYLLLWGIGFLFNAVRWSIHYAALSDPLVQFAEALLASVVIPMLLLGAYDILPGRRWRLDRVAWFLGVLFAAVTAVGIALDRLYVMFYVVIVPCEIFVVWCLWRGYLATRLSGYAFAAAAWVLQAVFFGAAVWAWSADVSNLVVGPLLVTPVIASFFLIAYQRSRREIRNAERKIRKIFDTAPIPLIITRPPRGEIEEFNQAAVDLSGVPAERLAGKTAVDIGIVADAEARQAMYDALSSGINVVRREITYLRGGMEKSPYSVNASRIDLDQGPHYIFALYDLTELRRAQTALEQLNAGLERQVAERTRDLEGFAYSVSHDLRAPLRHIDGFVNILAIDLQDKLDPESRRHFDAILRSVRRMSQLIDDLLQFSRLGNAALRRQDCDPNALVAAAISSLEPETKGRDIAWRLERLPRVGGDPSLLGQVWSNLISNAVKYTRPRAHAEIEIGCLSAGDLRPQHVFFVRDNGVGFDATYAAKLFGVFQRLHSETEFEGTGIGLAIVERIVRKHGGRVWAESKPGSGAVFYFSLEPAASTVSATNPAPA